MAAETKSDSKKEEGDAKNKKKLTKEEEEPELVSFACEFTHHLI